MKSCLGGLERNYKMYEIHTINSKTEKKLKKYIESRRDIKNKLDKLRENPYKNNGAHKLHGRFEGKWACWLGSNMRAVYNINNEKKIVLIEAVGTHNIY